MQLALNSPPSRRTGLVAADDAREHSLGKVTISETRLQWMNVALSKVALCLMLCCVRSLDGLDYWMVVDSAAAVKDWHCFCYYFCTSPTLTIPVPISSTSGTSPSSSTIAGQTLQNCCRRQCLITRQDYCGKYSTSVQHSR